MLVEAISALQAETATYPQAVQNWMMLMGASFACGIFFIRSKSGARWVLAALVLNIAGLIIGKITFPESSRTEIGTIVHLVFWSPILLQLWRSNKNIWAQTKAANYFNRIYLLWLCWSCLLMFTSLVLDLRQLVSTI